MAVGGIRPRCGLMGGTPTAPVAGLYSFHRRGVKSPGRFKGRRVVRAAGSAVQAGLVADPFFDERAAEVSVRAADDAGKQAELLPEDLLAGVEIGCDHVMGAARSRRAGQTALENIR